jgi:uncharacterized protein (TIGR02996 family)
VGSAERLHPRSPLLTADGIATLWQECLARPDDDATRGVLADLLQTDGDTRGELMMLQLLPADPEVAPARRDRIRAILRESGAAWLGPLTELACGARFDRGFVTRLELMNPAWPADDKRWHLDDRELASVQELLCGGASTELYRRVVTSPRLRSLRSIEIFDDSSLGALAETPAPIRHVACTYGRSLDLGAFVRRAALVLSTLADVTSVAILYESLAALRRQPWFERLTTLSVSCNVHAGLALWPALPGHMSLVIAPSPALDTCHRAYPFDSRLELHRDGVARVSGEWLLQSLDVLLELPSSITRLELEDTSELIALRVRRAVVKRRFEVVFRGLIGRAGNLRWGHYY